MISERYALSEFPLKFKICSFIITTNILLVKSQSFRYNI